MDNWVSTERKWQDYWKKNSIYRFDRENLDNVFSIDNPPRYASGALHIGHAVHYTHIDFIARYKRMRGFNVLFPLCFDVNGMPIEVNVEKKYNIKMNEYDRHKFIKLCEDFANENISEMKKQFEIIGESMDPSLYYQTDAKYYRKLTQISFIKLYEKGLIYRAKHPVHWCPRCRTALAASEVEDIQRKTHLNTILFTLSDGSKVEIATTRPELLGACRALAVHPDDTRFKHLHNGKALTPLYNREVPIITDKDVDMNFGSGVLMICTFGDTEDIVKYYRHGLDAVELIDESGHLTEAGGKYAGMAVEEARKNIIKDLEDAGLLVKKETLDQNVGSCWRCSTPLEYIQKEQWFIKTMEFRDRVMKIADEIQWYPEFMKQRLKDWCDSLTWDWCISRQRYFATPIPVWECENCGEFIIASEDMCYVDPTIDDAPVKKCPSCGGELRGSQEVFDTWMDSSITPLYNTFWNRNNALFEKLYPMSLRPQSHDIIRTWAFYTILRGSLLENEKPFNNIMMGGFILSPDGTPMHASKGNAVDPIKILDEYGADPLRYYASTCSLGEDNAFRWKDVGRGKKLVTKLINAGKLVNILLKDYDVLDKDLNDLKGMDAWIYNKYRSVSMESMKYFDNYRYEKARRNIEMFFWHDFADNYLEYVKNVLYTSKDEVTATVLKEVYLGIIKMLASILPHVAEDVYQKTFRRFEESKSVHMLRWPEFDTTKKEHIETGDKVKNIIESVRRWKSDNRMALNNPMGVIWLPAHLKEKITDYEDGIISTLKADGIMYFMEEDIHEKPLRIVPIYSSIGPRFRDRAKAVIKFILNADFVEEMEFEDEKLIAGKDYNIITTISIKGKSVEMVDTGDSKLLIETESSKKGE